MRQCSEQHGPEFRVPDVPVFLTQYKVRLSATFAVGDVTNLPSAGAYAERARMAGRLRSVTEKDSMKAERQSGSGSLTGDTDPQGLNYRWDSPDGMRRVLLDSSAAAELRMAAIQAFLAIPRRGVEIGGLLLGEVNGTVFRITGLEEVVCQHSSGPSFALDDTDRKSLRKLLVHHQEGAAAPVVGMYRSFTGRAAEPDDADRKLMREFFGQKNFVWLVLQPLSAEKCLAGYRFWREGELLPEPGAALFPFEAGQMTMDAAEPSAMDAAGHSAMDAAKHPTMENKPAPVEAPAVAAAVQPSWPEAPWHHRYRDEEETAKARAPLRSRIVLALLFGVLVAIAASAIYQLGKVKREPRWEPIHFDAKVSSGGLLLNWDPAAPAVAEAVRGVLLVSDSRGPVTVPLGPEQLRRGNFLYPASGGDLLFRLRLYGEGTQVTTDSLRVIEPMEPVPAEAPAAPAAPAAPVAATPAPEASLPHDAVPAHAPAPRHEVQPVLSQGIRRRLAGPTKVQVLVHVDESGRVTEASASKAAGEGLERYLASEGVRAARQWTFWPARTSDGRAVAATKTIVFEFTP
jgi:hypothetical protein